MYVLGWPCKFGLNILLHRDILSLIAIVVTCLSSEHAAVSTTKH